MDAYARQKSLRRFATEGIVPAPIERAFRDLGGNQIANERHHGTRTQSLECDAKLAMKIIEAAAGHRQRRVDIGRNRAKRVEAAKAESPAVERKHRLEDSHPLRRDESQQVLGTSSDDNESVIKHA